MRRWWCGAALGILGLGVGAATSAGAAELVTVAVNATGSGSCRASGCNNTDPGVIADPLTQNIGRFDTDYGWWSFVLPQPADYLTLVGASLSVWNPGSPVMADFPGVDFYRAAAISFAGLADQSTILASWTPDPLSSAGDPRWLTVGVAPFALGEILAALGQGLLVGANPQGVHGNDEFEAFFGGSGGRPPAVLTLSFAVPEPASWALMILGTGLAGAALRRRRLAA
jgi:hypothetical protein